MNLALLLALAALAQPASPATTPGGPAIKPAEQPAKPEGAKPADTKPDPAKSADWPFTSDKPETVGTGYRFCEGPTWTSANGGMFVFCDMAADNVYSWAGQKDAKPVELRAPAGSCIGSATDKDGRIVQVETAGRRIIRWEIKDGKATAPTEVASKVGDKRLGGMNDLCIRKDGNIYVSHGTWFMRAEDPEAIKFQGVLRIAPDGKASQAADGVPGPNGLCLSPDQKTLYVNEFSAAKIHAFPVKDDGTLGQPKVIADLAAMAKERGIAGRGAADGIRCDEKGNLYSTGPGGIWVVSGEGKFIAHLPTKANNLAFGGADGKTLFITTGNSVAVIGTKNKGL